MEKQMVMNKGANAILANIMDQEQRRVDSGQNKPTSNQISTIQKICSERNIPVDESRMATYDLAYAYIGELIKSKVDYNNRKAPVSEKQKARITECCNILGIEIPDFNFLEGGWGKSASLMIQQLNEKVKNIPQPMSDKQYEFILQIEQCPDAEFIGLNGDYEVAKTQLTKQEATDYINKYRNDYYNWIKTRASQDQIARIMQLCDMMETPIDAVQILQLNLETASEFIIQLESEYNAKIWQQTTLEPEDMYAVPDKDDDDYKVARKELYSFLSGIYASMNQAVEDDFMETCDLESLEDIKEIILEAKEFGYKLDSALDRINVLFTTEQKNELLNAFNQ